LARIAEQRERAQSKETQRKQELRKMARKRSLARANPEKSPYHMDIPTALRYLRASEVGRSPLDSVISITTGVVAPKGNPKLSGSISFPKPLKETKILVFTTVEEQHEIIGAVVSKIGGLELIEEVKKGMDLDYDMAFATPEMVQHLNPVARILGPKGLMPTVKKGTVAENLFDLIKSQAGSSPFRQKTEQISLPIGRVNFSDDEIIKNLVEAKKALERAISEQKVKRQSILGQTVISSTHGPGMIIKC
jgi:ribosomal protein L1